VCYANCFDGQGIPGTPLNTTAANEHDPEIECTVGIMKDRGRCIYDTLPFIEGIPKLMTIELLYFIAMWFNAFPVKSGICTKYIPRELVQCHRLSAKVHCKAPLVTYCEVHEKPDPSNSMTRCTHKTICMGPIGEHSRKL
jgi:hypothetical protein